MKMNPKERKEQAFTLIELLVVIAILAVLAVAVTLILNPAELIRQGRDSTRLSDLATINRALGLYQTDQIAKWMGTSTVVYTSLPDTTSTCASYGLPSLPSGWTYNCVQSSSSTKVDGSGWLPVDFTSMSFSSPLARLPLDPVNNATTSKYYTYISGGSWELSAVMEASSNKLGGDNDRVSGDGGEYMDIYETGTNLELLPVNRNPDLIGYWEFDEGSGLSAYDASGNGNDGTISVGTSSVQWVSGKKGDYALDFDGVDDYVSLPHQGGSEITMSMWINKNFTNYRRATKKGGGSAFIIVFVSDEFGIYLRGGAPSPGYHTTTHGGITSGSYYFITWTYNKSTLLMYVNGDEKREVSVSRNTDFNNQPVYLGKPYGSGDEDFNGLIDDVRIYNRALSAAEIEAMYNSY